MSTGSHYRGSATNFDHLKNEGSIVVSPDGGKVTIKPKALDIVWGGDDRYWRPINKPEDLAELLQVSWLEVNGSIDLNQFKEGDYKLMFNVSLKPDAFGWNNIPVYLMVQVGNNPRIWKKADLSQLSQNLKAGNVFFTIPSLGIPFRVPKEREGDKLKFGMYEIWKGRWKGGLVIKEVIMEKITN